MYTISPFQIKEHSPIYEQLYEHIKHEIVNGRIPPQTMLPSIRKMADFLGISTTPVELAYSQLRAEGFIESKPKSGYVVQELPEMEFGKNKLMKREQRKFHFRDTRTYEYDFHMSKNDFSLFPFQVWRRISNQILSVEEKDLLFYGDPQGEWGLRCEIANYLHQYRGVECSPEQVVIGSDQFGLFCLISLMLKTHTDRIAVENPGYPLLPATFQQNGFKLLPVSLEDDGIYVPSLYEHHIRLVYVTPSHQFPKGMIMPIHKRLKLAEWAKEVNGYIIEDDYDGEFRYHGKPIPALQGIAPDKVVYIGGFSQVLAPAFCIHYLVLPESLLDSYANLQDQLLFEQSSSRIHQIALQRFMEDGYLVKHIRRMRNIYRKKHDTLIAAVSKHFGESAKIIGKDAGFHVLLQLESQKSEKELLDLAKQAGIKLSSAAYTWFEPPAEQKKEFILGFAGIPEDRIEAGIKRLKEVWS